MPSSEATGWGRQGDILGLSPGFLSRGIYRSCGVQRTAGAAGSLHTVSSLCSSLLVHGVNCDGGTLSKRALFSIAIKSLMSAKYSTKTKVEDRL